MHCLAMTAVAAFILLPPVRADEEKVPLDKVPKAVLDAAKKRFPKGEVKGASKEVADGKTTYEISMKENGKNIDISLTPEGTITLIEKEVAFKELPKAVAATFNNKYPKATYQIIEEVIKVAEGKEMLEYYEAHLTTTDKKKIEAEVLPDGKFKSETEVKDEQACGGADDKKSEKASTKESKKVEDDEDDDKGAKSKKVQPMKSKKGGDDEDDKRSARGEPSGFHGEQKGQHDDDENGEDGEKDKKKKKDASD